ncbi:aminotransferase class V-fold PLP-dependent enzyme [Stenotrophomonas maltophilia]|uniref:cysteine desulfurase family protein n=1 Tax=Stenotrophomonas maltophilia TaxID=40324 RepID=UPI001F2A015D|nr:cysteine desulfurase family protein [Stenotrophomonas maltophilia]MCF3528039.1 aminotransferase class V-fold PLP-dependent enzyme [Stenotrophomonas maltophilia]MCF3531923.1 aminotransferase class V-fold PLP-dependent enzyme [Stenotrophomonas maltophilia]
MAKPELIYADYASSSPPLPEVVDAMLEWLGPAHANPHADHLPGHRASQAIDDARQHIANLIDADPEGVIFTSGATESNNLAIKGLVGQGADLLYSPLDHSSIVEVTRDLERQGLCRSLPVPHDVHGRLDSHALAAMALQLRPQSLVAIAHGNNEIGTVQSLPAITRALDGSGASVHVDASQTGAHVPISVYGWAVNSLSLSSHKLYGPAGIGALWMAQADATRLRPLFHGGGQQNARRPGTLPTFLAVGMGKAAELAKARQRDNAAHLVALALRFRSALGEKGVDTALIGEPVDRLPGHLCLQLPGANALDVLARVMPRLAISAGAACASGELRASRVLRALGMEEEAASQVIRISFGLFTSTKDVDLAAEYLSDAVGEVCRPY